MRWLIWLFLLICLGLAAQAGPSEDRIRRVFQAVAAAKGDSNFVFLRHPEFFSPKAFRAMSEGRRREVDFLCGTQGRVTKLLALTPLTGNRIKATAYVESVRSGSRDFIFTLSSAGTIEDIAYPWGGGLIEGCQRQIQAERLVTQLRWSEDGQALATATMGGEITVWDAEGKKQKTLERSPVELEELFWHKGVPLSLGRDGLIRSSAQKEPLAKLGLGRPLRFSLSGNRLAVGDESNIQILNLDSLQVIARFAAPSGPLLLNKEASILCVRAARSWVLIDPLTGQRRKKIEAYSPTIDQAFTPEGNLVLASDLGITEVSVPDGKQVRSYHGGECRWFRLSPDGRSMLAPVYDQFGIQREKTLLYRDRTEVKPTREVPGTSMDFLSGNRLLQFQSDPPLARILSAEGDKLRSIALPKEVGPSLKVPERFGFALNPERTLLAIGLPDGGVRIYKMAP